MRIIGNDHLISQVTETLRFGHIFHACIISGPEGLGKKTMAKYLAAGAVCSDSNPPCGRCESCRKVEKGIHPDIEFIRPDGQQIKVDQIRDMRLWLHVLPNDAPRKVAIIEDSGRMNTNAQNAILKILEEPPSSSVILLVVESEAELLPTILSRCIRFRMQPLSEVEMKQELLRRNKKLTETEAEELAIISGGNLGRALNLIKKKSTNGYSEKIVTAIADCNIKELINLAVSMEKSVKRDALTDIIIEVRNQLGRAASCLSGSNEYSYDNEVESMARRYSKSKLMKMVSICSHQLKYCDSNVGVGHITGAFVSLISEEIKK